METGEGLVTGVHATQRRNSTGSEKTTGKMTESHSKSGHEDIDISCRICRGEGSDEEPLFYPCKCSGSIKFVHQTCLMEWLSHSQKKYCELCKTHFRFTKLYSSQMPQTLPAPIFLRQLVIHMTMKILAYARILLVAFVWLGWLPWSIRHVWGALFYLADGRWALVHSSNHDTSTVDFHARSVFGEGNSNLPVFVQATATKNAHSLRADETTSPSSQEILMAKIVRLVFPRLYHWTTSDDPYHIPEQHSSGSAVASASLNGSLLSDIQYLQNVSSNPRLNRILVHTLEGQLICLLIVATFILVFLIREWVINQQPPNEQINNNDGSEEGTGQTPTTPLERPRDEHGREQGHGPGAHAINRPRRLIAVPRRRRDQIAPTDPNTEPQNGVAGHSTSRYIGTPSDAEGAQVNQHEIQQLVSSDIVPQSAPNPPFEEAASREDPLRPSSSRARPSLQPRNADQAPVIQRNIEEGRPASASQEWPGLETFKSIWERADRNPTQVLQIIDEEGKRRELGWIVTHMERLQDSSPPSSRAANQSTSLSRAGHLEQVDENPTDNRHDQAFFPSLDQSLDINVTIPTQTTPATLDSSDTSLLPEWVANPDRPMIDDSPLDSLQSDRRGRSIRSTEALIQNAEAVISETADNTDLQRVQDNTMHARPSSMESGTANIGTVAGSTSPNESVSHQENSNGSAIEHNVLANDTFLDRIVNKLWGNPYMDQVPRDEDVLSQDDEHIVQNIAQEPPFVPVALTRHGHGSDEDGEDDTTDEDSSRHGDGTSEAEAEPASEDDTPAENDRDPAVVAAAAVAGIDLNNADAIDDAEDMDGILELVGLRGPLTGLLQNALLSDFLLTFTIAACIWLPYIWGKIAAVFMANPITCFITVPLQFASRSADTILDLTLYFGGSIFAVIEGTAQILSRVIHQAFPEVDRNLVPTFGGRRMSDVLGTGTRVRIESALFSIIFSLTPDFPAFSASSHAALIVLKARMGATTRNVFGAAQLLFYEYPLHFHHCLRNHPAASEYQLWADVASAYSRLNKQARIMGGVARAFLSDLKSLKIRLHASPGTSTIDYSLVHWNTQDKVLAILLGYAFFALVGYLYLRVGSYFYGLKKGEKLQGAVADTLRQAGGVLKVVLIIGIEMIIFPLYCGLLLDAALLPIFEGVGLKSRLSFLIGSPLTGIFVHWFIGTCYMFHFALFVSMCRRILRKGCLYFIRDPDDPTFHPVRDVLERPITTQLNKIAQSALVYGCLVIVCLGVVVWVVSHLGNPFPIRWASGQPTLEVPWDLLYFNFALPFLIRRIEVSSYVTAVYSWWFHKCAKMLRLSDFLFGERHPTEEGRHVRRSWLDVFHVKKGDVSNPVIGEDREKDVYFLRNGTFVRAPASDSVRMRRGQSAFLEVTENNERIDGQPDSDGGPHGKRNKNYTKVYLPPRFRIRVGVFVLSVWLFAAFTGSVVFLLPLAVGRLVIAAVISRSTPINDLYALSLGVNICAAGLCGATYAPSLLGAFVVKFIKDRLSFADATYRLRSLLGYLFGLGYLAVTTTIILPLLFSFTVELYLFLPLNAYMNSVSRPHGLFSLKSWPTIYLVQSWVLGLLYTRCIYRLVTTYPTGNTRVATAVRAITRDGVLHPDVRLATRSFVVPSIGLCGFLLLLPAPFGWALTHPQIGLLGIQSPEIQGKIFSYAYPGLLGLVMAVWCTMLIKRAIGRWRMRIRDEVYLIGERLHNFGEQRSGTKNRKEGPARANSVTTRVDVGL